MFTGLINLPISERGHNPFFNHDPRMRRNRNMAPRNDSSIHMAVHTPANPIVGARSAASGRRTSHMLPKFITAGTTVSPTPIITP